MRVFVTGGTGYVGAHIVRRLTLDGHEVVVLTRDRAAALNPSNTTVIEGSLESVESYAHELNGCDACIHNAILWDEEPTELQLKDPRASIALFEAAASSSVKQFIYTSSVAVHRPFKMKMSEDDKLTPTDMYGATKAVTEVLLSALSHSHQMRFNVVRPGPVIGRAVIGKPNCDGRFMKFIELGRSGQDILVAKDDSRQFIAVTDLANVFEALLESDKTRETYIAVSEDLITWESIAEEIIMMTNSTSKIIHDGVPVTHSFSVDKLARDLGMSFQASPHMEEHIRNLVGLV